MQTRPSIQPPRAMILLVAALCAATACKDGSLTMEDRDGKVPGMHTGNNSNNASNNNPAPAPVVSGRVTLHRLNRAEYNNTVRDLLGVQLSPADAFPSDDFGYGFNNIADVLTMSPLLFELYEQAADTLVEEAMRAPALSKKVRAEAEDLMGSVGGASGEAWNLWSNGSVGHTITVTHAGRHRFTIRAWGTQGGPDPAKMELLVDEATLTSFDVPHTAANPGTFTFEADLTAGDHLVAAAFTNDYYDAAAGLDRNLLVDWIEVEGPLGLAASSPTRDRLMVCQPADQQDLACARQVLAAFGKRAWRRALTDDELTRLVSLIDVAKTHGEDLDAGIKLAMKTILLSPHFIFRVEQERPDQADKPYLLSDHELAARLSYFLWSTTPDDTLLELADQGQLQNDATLRAQVKRMLADPRAVALVDNFATQWLYIDAIREVHPDYMLFPQFDDALAEAMREETRLFITELIFQDKPVSDLFLADYTYLNERLAQHYGISGVTGDALRRVQLPDDSPRGGLLGQGSLLTARSYPDRTSPVLRGVWVLKQLMCSAPPAPPPGVEGLESSVPGEDLTLRERLELHREKPECAACHLQMDAIGFGLERFDASGAWRDSDHGKPIDDHGAFPDGRSFQGPTQMANILGNDRRLTECVSSQMLTYAIGRGLYTKSNEPDRPQLDALTKQVNDEGATFQDVITSIVLSDAFRKKQNDTTAQQGAKP